MSRFLRVLFVISCLSFISGGLFGQRAMTVEELPSWRRISDRSISNDGRWVAAKIAPWEGDATLRLYNQKGSEEAVYTPAGTFSFSHSSDYLLISRTPAKALTDSLKLAKTKKDKMPMNGLVIRRLSGGEESIDSVRSYRLAEAADWLAYQRNRKDSTLYVRSLDGTVELSFPSVSEYRFAKKSHSIYFISGGDTLGMKAGLYALNPDQREPELVKSGREYYQQVTWNDNGDLLAFLHTEKKDSAYRSMCVWYWSPDSEARLVAERGNAAFPENWVVSEHGKVSFSEDGRRIFFGTSPQPRQPDTTRLAEDWPGVQVWSWNEPVQYTAQEYNKKEDLKRSYMAIYDLSTGKVVQLSDQDLPNCTVPNRGNADFALLSTTRPYSLSSMWEYRSRRDTWLMSLTDGSRQWLKEADHAYLRPSPEGKYAFWYAPADSMWYTLHIESGKEISLPPPDGVVFWDEDNDVPDHPGSYGVSGWTKDDKYILLNDRYDIWRFDPSGREAPVNLTRNGRETQTVYHLISLDPEARFVDLSDTHYLTGVQEETKRGGYYQISFTQTQAPKALLSGDFMLSNPLKAKHSDAVVYTWQTYQDYPELRLTDLSFKKSVQLTREGAQRNGVKWGTVEMVSWTSLDGKPLRGLLYKPEGFDPSKKYPLIVNFYERNTETLHSYRLPNPNRSTIDYRLYNSNDYVIFNPDVVYEDGYPGQSCFNCVMPGISMLLDQGFIDEKSIGAQGHSWGGYQVAYLATRTNLFAAIESGAPVVNMFSAYGGIRWGSGRARAFQYEYGQSRIGKDPWSGYREFVENSPLFFMDKVTTPILIMHNDEDGHVPWYQGIEYFVALKRLGKPAWMLNYTGEIHWPGKMPNRVDFQMRMFQFFNHYLKKEPMPKWMSEGVPVVDQEFELGYEIEGDSELR